jgi:hypothetical protein
MARFATFEYMLQTLNLCRNQTIIALATLWQVACGKVQPSPTLTDSHENHIRGLLKKHSAKSPEVCGAIKARLEEYTRPAMKIIEPEIWDTHLEGYPHGHPVVKTHLKSDFGDSEFSDVVSNITRVKERVLSATDERYLRFILTHPSGWSSTSPEHANDAWVKYLRAKYSLIGLMPILDSVMYAEELVDFPPGLKEWTAPSLFLLATRESYYVYEFDPDEGSGLFIAGKTLEEVYSGLKECRYYRCQDGSWEQIESSLVLKDYDERLYFPVYYRRDKLSGGDGKFCLEEDLEEFPSQLDSLGKKGRTVEAEADM